MQSAVGGSTAGKLDHREKSSTRWANGSARRSAFNPSVGAFPVVSELHKDEQQKCLIKQLLGSGSSHVPQPGHLLKQMLKWLPFAKIKV